MAKVAILGYGVVGSGVGDMLTKNADVISRAAGCEVKLAYVVELREVRVPDGVTLTNRFEDVLEDPEVRIVVETIGGTRAAGDFTRRALAAGKHVITSNKELVANLGDELIKFAQQHGAMYMFEASVGGGIPILRPISQCLSGNHLTGIDGIVNGSTNYLLTRMAENGVSFPAALGEAKRLGYVEENPAADIEGWDARRKLAILANAAFGSKLSDEIMIPTEGISAITSEDIECARAFGMQVKLIAHARLTGEVWHGWVHPAAVAASSPLYGVSKAFNAILVAGDFIGEAMFYGPGAGSYPTASAVVGDVIDVAQHLGGVKRRLEFPVTPAFRAPHGGETMRVVTSALPAGGAREAIAQALPGSDMRDVGALIAILTPVMPLPELIARLNELSSKGVKFGAVLYVVGGEN